MNGAELRILLVEDDPTDARLLRDLLRTAYGHEPTLTHVATLAEAKAKLLENRGALDLVLLDSTLPDATGRGALEQLRMVAPAVPVVVLTQTGDEQAARAFMQSGERDDFVKRRADGPMLARAIRYAMQRHRTEEAGRRLLTEQAARVEAEASERRASFLAEAGRILAAEAQTEESLRQVAQLAVTLLGGGCRIDLLDQDELRAVASAHAEPSQEEALHSGPSLAPRALRSEAREMLARGEPVVVSGADLFDLYQQHSPGMTRAVLIAPILARGRLLGRMLVVREDVPVEGEEAPHEISREDLSLITACASRVGLAVDNARLLSARNEVLAVVSHDMRNPLMLINTAAAMLGRSEVTDEQRSRWLGTICRASTQMTRLIRDLLDVTSIDAGQLSLTLSRQDARALLDEAAELLRPLTVEKRQQLEISIGEGLPRLHGDHDRLLQVLGNLVGNAVKFTPEGGRISISASRHAEGTCFSVRDSGSGIPPEVLPHIFDRYWQARRDRREGVGLGLAIARGIVRAHGGELWAVSRPGEGAVLHFTVRTDPDDATTEA